MASFFDNKARAAAAKAATISGAASSKPNSNEQTQNQPWVEKYRPKTLADVTSQAHTTALLQRTLHAANLPHLLFYGPPGTGKTSTILALSKQLFGPALLSTRVLELNASDERGINIVRRKIKDFARQQLSTGPPADSAYRAQYPCPPFKIIVLDEADSMTQDAQSALRRTMETYSRITRFCLVCNYVTRIIDPLASRCSKFRFKSLDTGDALARVHAIAGFEHVPLGPGAAEALVHCADGDLRRAITFLQSAARLVGTASGDRGAVAGGAKARKRTVVDDDDDDDEMDVDGGLPSAATNAVTVAIIEEIAGVIPDTVITGLMKALQPLGSGKPSPYDTIAPRITALIADGWSATQLLAQLFRALVADETVLDRSKNAILGIFSEADKRLVDGADEHLVVLDLCLRVALVLGAVVTERW